MKTRRRDNGTTDGLPPPPAPTARDANPWTISSEEKRRPSALETGFPWRDRKPVVATSSNSSPTSPTRSRSTRIEAGTTAGRRPPRRSLFSLVVPAAIAVAAITGAVRALQSGDFRAALGPVIATVFAAFVLMRLMRRRS